MKKKLIIFAVIAAALIAIFVIVDTINESNVDIKVISERITVEAGTQLSTYASDYIHSTSKVMSNCTVDLSGVKTDVVGTGYILEIRYKKRIFDIFVDVVDTTAPKISVENNKLTIPVNETLKMHELPVKIEDVSATEYTFSNGTEAIHFDKLGTYKDTITVTDHSKNTASLDIEIEVIDIHPPVINGVKNYTVYQGTPVDARAGVTATDIEDGDLTAQMEVSGYNVNQLGTQTITYKVKDVYGNETTATATLTVLKIPETTAARR